LRMMPDGVRRKYIISALHLARQSLDGSVPER
jgi:hypothetical protein